MVVLQANKFFWMKGGAERYFFSVSEELERRGHGVVHFSMEHPANRPSPYAQYFVANKDYESPAGFVRTLSQAASFIRSREAARKIGRLVQDHRPDVAHLHNTYHQLTPSIIEALDEAGVPVVMTLHDYKLICPSYRHFARGEYCYRCRGGRYHQAVLGRCVKDSRAASLLAAVETAHQRWRNLYPRAVSTFLCPSRFLREKYAAWGFAPDRLRHLPNFVDLDFWHPDRLPRSGARDAVVYFGRISREKGLRTLLEAQALWEAGHADGDLPQPPALLIAGDGPCLGNLKARIALLELKTARVLGPQSPEDLRGLLGRALCTVLPSRAYENAPLAVLESLAAGVPVAAFRSGGTPEMVLDGKSGLLVDVGDVEGLAGAMARLAGDATLRASMGAAGRARALGSFSVEQHLSRMWGVLTRAAAP